MSFFLYLTRVFLFFLLFFLSSLCSCFFFPSLLFIAKILLSFFAFSLALLLALTVYDPCVCRFVLLFFLSVIIIFFASRAFWFVLFNEQFNLNIIMDIMHTLHMLTNDVLSN